MTLPSRTSPLAQRWAPHASYLCSDFVAQGIILQNYTHLHLHSSTHTDQHVLVSVQFTKAVEAKQVAQQDAERARFVVLKADQVSTFPCCCTMS